MSTKRLNNLSGREWLPATRSAFVDGVTNRKALSWDNMAASFTVLSHAPPRDKRKMQHPATFPDEDAARLIRFFTQKGGRVLDPFLGTGSTAVACVRENRACTGYELYPHWAAIARTRVAEIISAGAIPVRIMEGDALEGVQTLPPPPKISS